jgi:hypothetical protein
MKKVICIDDKKQPAGANVVEGKEYEVEYDYINALDQRVYIIKGAVNEGTTKWGMCWIGYNSKRFKSLEDNTMEFREVIKEENFVYN